MTSAHDAASELRRRLPDLGAVKMHKLLYYLQGWHLAAFGEPFFDEAIEAWVNGPVVASLWADEKHGRSRPARRPLDDRQAATVDYVTERYGRLPGRDLIELTHAEAPWRDLSVSEDTAAPPSPVIEHEALRAWFLADEDHRAHEEAVERSRRRSDIYGFAPLELPVDAEPLLHQAQGARQIVDHRPTR